MSDTDIKELRKELEVKQDICYNITSGCWERSIHELNKGNLSISFKSVEEEIKKLTENISEEIADLSFILKKLEPIEFENIPTYGDHMTLEDFKECVEFGGFVDYDGFGYYATKDKMSNKIIIPSNFKKDKVLDTNELTHVVWLNR